MLSTLVFAGFLVALPANAAGDFQLTLSPSGQALLPGTSVSFTVHVAAIGGFSAPVTLSIPTLPSGITAGFSVNPVTPTGDSTLTVTAANTVGEGDYSLPVTGTSGGVTHVATFSAKLNFALRHEPSYPPCDVTVEGTVIDAETHLALPGATVNGSPTATGVYQVKQPGTDFGTHKASVSISASLEPDYWDNALDVKDIPCGTTRTGQDVTLLRKIRFTISGKVVEGTADASTNWKAVAKVPETPISGAAVNAWTFCSDFGNDLQLAGTGADGVSSPPMVFDLSYNNAPRDVFSFASFPELGSPDGCPPPHPYPPEAAPQAIDGYWWSSTTASVDGPAADLDTASTPNNLDIVKQFTLVKKCSTSVSGNVVYNATGLPAAGVKLNASTLGPFYPYRDSWNAATDAHTAVVTDANGNFTFPAHSLRLWHNNQPTDYSVFSTFVPGHAGWAGTQSVRLAGNCADQPTVTVRIKAPPPHPQIAPGVITGHLYDAETGNPVVAKSVCTNSAPTLKCFTTDSSGSYRLDHLRVLSRTTATGYLLSAPGMLPSFDADYWQAFRSGVPVRSGRTTKDVDLRVVHKRFGSISGIVRDPTTGLTVPTAQVAFTSDTGQACQCATTYDGQGGYRIDHIELNDPNNPDNSVANAPVTGTLSASADGYLSASGQTSADYPVTVQADVPTVQDAELIKIVVCETTATITGTVSNIATGARIAGALVEYPLTDLGGPFQTTTDAQGRYVLAGIPVSTNFPQQAQLTASAVGFIPQTRSVTLACGALVTVPPDTTPPACSVTSVTGPPTQLKVTLQDGRSGLASVEVITATNATVDVPPFTVGSTALLVVTATKVNEAAATIVALRVKDVAGNVTECDPVLATLNGPVDVQQATGVPDAEHLVTFRNGSPGLSVIAVRVNRRWFTVDTLRSGAQKTIDVAAALLPGPVNTIDFSGIGRAGATANVIIWDGNGSL